MLIFKVVFHLFAKPHMQLLIMAGVMLLLLLLSFAKRTDTLWVIAGISYIVFIAVNSVMLFWNEHHWQYFFYSLLVSVIFIGVGWGQVKLIENLYSTTGSEESSMIFLVVIYHPFVLLLCIFIKSLLR
jgi:hypothetical protein